MKKTILIISIFFLFTGCSIDKEQVGWLVQDLPKYEGSGDIKSIVNKGIVKIENLNESDKNEYIDKVKNEYSSVIVDNDEIYQAVNEAGKMIKIEYDKKNNELKISKEDK